jgi:hypothetical protein
MKNLLLAAIAFSTFAISCSRISVDVTKRKVRSGYYVDISVNNKEELILRNAIKHASVQKQQLKEEEPCLIPGSLNISEQESRIDAIKRQDLLIASAEIKNVHRVHKGILITEEEVLLNEKATPAKVSEPAPQRYCTSAIISFACAISGIFFVFLCIPAIIFGIIGLVQISYHKELRGRGFAMAGLIIGIIELIYLFIAITFLLLFLKSI